MQTSYYHITFLLESVGLESGSISHWLTSELVKLNIPAICIDARHIAAVLSVNINKTDKNDARGIADAMRCKLYREVNVKNQEEIAISTLLNARKQLVDQRVQLMNCIRGLLKPFGIRLSCGGKGKLWLDEVESQLQNIPELARLSIVGLLTTLKGLLDAIKVYDKLVKKRVEVSQEAGLLMSIPGIGPITALRFLAEICNPKRFRRSRSVGAYIGLTPNQYSSGETLKMGRISKRGPLELRTHLMEAGVVILTRVRSWSKLKAWGFKLLKKHGLKKAATAVGRKLAVIMHQMLIKGEKFRMTDKKLDEVTV